MKQLTKFIPLIKLKSKKNKITVKEREKSWIRGGSLDTNPKHLIYRSDLGSGSEYSCSQRKKLNRCDITVFCEMKTHELLR